MKKPSDPLSPGSAPGDKPNRKRKTPAGARRFVRQAKKLTDRVRAGIAARIAEIGPDKLKKMLVACGITATVAVAIIALSKLTPVVFVLLAFLGLNFVLELWMRFRPY